MARFRQLAFVCTHERDATDPRGCCKARGSLEVVDRLKALTHEHKLGREVRVVASGCLNYCKKGVTAVVLSADPVDTQTWYTHLTPADADALFDSHLRQGKPLERLVEPQGDDPET